MARKTQPRRVLKPKTHFNFSGVAKHVASIHLGEERNLPGKLLRRLAFDLGIKRLSLVEYDSELDRITRLNYTGFKSRVRDFNATKLVVRKVARERKPFITQDISQHPELVGPYAKYYRTPACAVAPVIFQNELVGILCLSNLSASQVQELSARVGELQSVAAQLGQLIYHWQFLLEGRVGAAREGRPDRGRFFELLDEFIDNINSTYETNAIVSIFSQLLRETVPFNAWAMLFNALDKAEEVIVSLAASTSEDELKVLVSQIEQPWRRPMSKGPINVSDVSIVCGDKYLVEAGSVDPAIEQRVEVSPIYLDNNLFGVIGLLLPQEAVLGEDHRQFIKVMSHHLGMHLKKNYLMVANQELEFQDKLTGLFNQRHFYTLLEREFQRAVRYNVPFSLLFVDVDHFKDINDTYGPEEGDNVLKEISRIIVDNHRATDLVSRYSGERFVMALPETHLRESEMVADRLRRLIANHTFFIASENIFIKVTASLGVASFLDHRPRSVAQFIEFADTALYIAKRSGRNRVVTYTHVINMMMKDSGQET